MGSTDPVLWSAVNGSGFSLTFGSVQTVITPNLANVSSMEELAARIQEQLDLPAPQGIGPGRVQVKIEGNIAIFKNISGNFAKVEGLGTRRRQQPGRSADCWDL